MATPSAGAARRLQPRDADPEPAFPTPVAYTPVMPAVRHLRLLLPLLVASAGAAQVSLAEVAKLARDRAERSRPAQTKALEPYWADLALGYDDNRQLLTTRIAEIAALGDSVVPMLLEKLTPGSGGGDAARNLAGNCRRVLERLDPGSFVDALAELAASPSSTARTESIRLLGAAATPQAATLLSDLLDRVQPDEKRLVLRALRQHKSTAAAPRAAALLGSSDAGTREEALTYLAIVRATDVAPVVVAALANERDGKLLPLYVEFFAGSTKANDAVARALLPLLDRDRLDWQESRRLVQALAGIAPPGHEPTIKRLTTIVDDGDPSSLSVQAAVTLRALGEKQGVTKLKKSIDELLRKGRRKQEGQLYEHRANLHLATEDYADALADFEKVAEFQDSLAMRRRAFAGMMRCEAHRKRTTNLIKLMRTSDMTVAEIEAIGGEDAEFAEVLKQEKVKQALQAMAKDPGGK